MDYNFLVNIDGCWPVADCIVPTVNFKVYFEHKTIAEIYGIGGVLKVNGKKIGNLFEAISHSEEREFHPSIKAREEKEKFYFNLECALSPSALNLIEDTRNLNLFRDVDFQIEVVYKCIVLELEQVQTPKNPNIQNTIPQFISSYRFCKRHETAHHKIPSSDWISKFIPALNLGRIVVYELEKPEIKLPEEDPFKGFIDKMNNALRKMEIAKSQGDWHMLAKESREVWDGLKDKQKNSANLLIKDLLKKNGLSGEPLDAYFNLFQSFFSFGSKFSHFYDSQGNFMPDIPIQKEDAMLLYTMTLNIANVLSTKVLRLSQ